MLAGVMLAGAPLAHATIITYQAALDGASEAPPNASPGTGFASVITDDVAKTMAVHITFSGLIGTTTASHIHCCTAAPGTAGVATTVPNFFGFPLGVTSGVYDVLLDMTLASSYSPGFITAHGGTTAGAEAALFAGISLGEAYVNIHTTSHPGGEIRGFLTQVPEPASLALTRMLHKRCPVPPPGLDYAFFDFQAIVPPTPQAGRSVRSG